jgi:hypothetical protein
MDLPSSSASLLQDRIVIDLTQEDWNPASNARPISRGANVGAYSTRSKPEASIIRLIAQVVQKRKIRVMLERLEKAALSCDSSDFTEAKAPVKRAALGLVSYLLHEISGLAYDIVHGNIKVTDSSVLFLVKVLVFPSCDLSVEEFDQAKTLFPGVMVHGRSSRAPIDFWIVGHQPIPLVKRHKFDPTWKAPRKRPLQEIASDLTRKLRDRHRSEHRP